MVLKNKNKKTYAYLERWVKVRLKSWNECLDKYIKYRCLPETLDKGNWSVSAQISKL